MNDIFSSALQDEELEAILREVRGEPAVEEPVEEEPSKSWSMEDIDRLIAGTNGEEYIPPEPKESAHDKFARFFTTEFDEDMFTIRPMNEKEEPAEMQDISSGSSDEMDGQETLFADEEPEEEEFVDMYYSEDVIAKAVQETGIRGVLCWCCLDEQFTTQKGNPLDNCKHFCESHKNVRKIIPGIGLQGVYVCGEETCLRAKEFSNEKGLPLNIHVS